MKSRSFNDYGKACAFRNDIFIFNEQKYKILGVSEHRVVDSVRCKNLNTNKIEYFDVDDDVFVEDEVKE